MTLYPPQEKANLRSMLPAHAKSHMRFVHLSTISPVILHKLRGENRMPEVVLLQSTEGVLVIRHLRCSCRVVGEPVFGVVALYMQGWCLDKYEPNGSETVHKE